MANFTPSASWTWLTTNGRLALRYGAAPSELQVTPVSSMQHVMQHSVEAGSAFAFTLEHAEMFWTFWHALEPLQYAEQGRFAAAIDATACLCFLQQQGQKSWHFQTISSNFVPSCSDIVLLAGVDCSALALVLDASEHSSLVLLLANLTSLSGKLIAGGTPILLLNNRLQAWQPQPIRVSHLPKTA